MPLLPGPHWGHPDLQTHSPSPAVWVRVKIELLPQGRQSAAAQGS